VSYGITCVRFGLVVMSFVPCLFADISPHQRLANADSELNGSERPKLCPKLSASFLSVVFFWWFTP